ncbi:MgtC/SapB family protein [Sporosarcina sp. Marseille-Q4063]|uniref:MgtC/SapB family protein n=1 Tax=Sporosarcina sp. Marseille-Q4063 TaxID=2810514 RepID=UPI001BAFEE02|nr:MgtC/SapB family protein [Sporosarcina sp. Marseille-Q4063]QUW21516.1 MgtC/SapB family protein [Sporosarcina sp. Marseille-Q4063]
MENIQGLFINYEVYFKILISGMLGLLIGWDRTSKHKPAGLKTFTYVAVACTLITIVSIESVEVYNDSNNGIRMDPMRLAAQIVSGLGFLGAGVILKDGLQVKGLTSASMIFFVGGVGIGIGAGFYSIVIFATLVTFILVKLSNVVERQENRPRIKQLFGKNRSKKFEEDY